MLSVSVSHWGLELGIWQGVRWGQRRATGDLRERATERVPFPCVILTMCYTHHVAQPVVYSTMWPLIFGGILTGGFAIVVVGLLLFHYLCGDASAVSSEETLVEQVGSGNKADGGTHRRFQVRKRWLNR